MFLSSDNSLPIMLSFGFNPHFLKFVIIFCDPIQCADSSSVFGWCGEDFFCIVVVEHQNIVVTYVLLNYKFPGKVIIIFQLGQISGRVPHLFFFSCLG